MRKILCVFLCLCLLGCAFAEDIVKVQEKLVLLGFSDDLADGLYGDATKEAVRLFRQEMGLPEGDIDSTLIAALDSEEAVCVGNGITENDETLLALRAQRRLCALGYLAGVPDGVFGASSMKAMRSFCSENAIALSSGAEALKLLFSENAKNAPHTALGLTDKGEAVLAIQKKLLLSGFWDGTADGEYGRETAKGVKNLQTWLNKNNEAYAAISGGTTDGIADTALQKIFLADTFSEAPAPQKKGSEGMEVRRLQTRLLHLGYLTASPDGGYGETTAKAVKVFQKRNGLKATGDANADTMFLLHSDKAKEALKPYKLVISTEKQKIYVYEAGEDEQYKNIVHTFTCSTGSALTPTYPGTYTETYPEEEQWTSFSQGVYAEYVYRVSANCSIHSPWYTGDEKIPDRNSVAQLGSAVTAGDVIVSEPDAEWIWKKCPKGTVIVVE